MCPLKGYLRSMRGWLGLVAASLLMAAAGGASGHAAVLRADLARTQVLHWSPFDPSGSVKRRLRLKTTAGGCDHGSSSEQIGGVGYRCSLSQGHHDFLINTCWRDGPGRTDFAICVTAPWARTGYRLRVPRFMLDDGVTFAAAPEYPWALELIDGSRCTSIATGSGPIPTPAGPRRDDFVCAHGVNLADLHRNRGLWTISATAGRLPSSTDATAARCRQAFATSSSGPPSARTDTEPRGERGYGASRARTGDL